MKPVIYVFLNKSLGMSTGKASAQASHATAMAVIASSSEMINSWVNSAHKTIIVLQARNEQHMHNIYDYLKERKVPCVRIIDEGVNEIDPHTTTALATAILNKEDEHIVDTLSSFELYRDIIKVTMEFEK